jgi:hypothetical protein
MPKRKTSTGPQTNPGCSDGALLVITRMQSNPEDFRGYDARLRDVLEAAQRTLTQPSTASAAYQMSRRDAQAIMTAAETYLFEPWLMESVLRAIAPAQPRKEVGLTTARYKQEEAKRREYANTATTATATATAWAPTFEESFQREMERYKQEDFKRREYEYAMNKKPFGDFV